MRFAGVLFLLAGMMAFNAAAAELSHQDRYFTIGAVHVQEISDDGLGLPIGERSTILPQANIAVDPSYIEMFEEFVNIGKQAWQIVVNNKPVWAYEQNTATIVPKGVSDWRELQGWSAPQSRTFRLVFENLYGMDVVEFDYRILYTYGGNVNGKGAYLSNVTIVPAKLNVTWGFTFNANVSIPNITNAGSHLNPMAATELQIHWSVDTVLKHMENTDNFYVRGDGAFRQL
ncbi:MAG: hypothetical protein NDJ90_08500 [Oligoflexia bacterium]|nr:hypothetical protein [Oligoflexia bacterium]